MSAVFCVPGVRANAVVLPVEADAVARLGREPLDEDLRDDGGHHVLGRVTVAANDPAPAVGPRDVGALATVRVW